MRSLCLFLLSYFFCVMSHFRINVYWEFCVLACGVNCGTLYKQVCAFLKYIQSMKLCHRWIPLTSYTHPKDNESKQEALVVSGLTKDQRKRDFRFWFSIKDVFPSLCTGSIWLDGKLHTYITFSYLAAAYLLCAMATVQCHFIYFVKFL